MRIIFAGTPEFARVALAELHNAGFDIALVLTQPDRPAGRGMKLQASAVKQFALDHQIALAQPRSLRLDGKYPDDAAAARAAIQAAVDAGAEAMVVAAYGLILPQWALDAPRLGCFNIHASLLPRWRGAAPIHRAIQAGDPETGVTIMQMDVGLDTGDMLLVEKFPIEALDTTATLHDKLAPLGGRLMVAALKLAASGGLRPVPQPGEGVSYAHKIEKAEAAVAWTQPVAAIERHIRAMNPFPGATAQFGSDTIKLWSSEIDSCSRPSDMGCGTILSANADGVRVACLDGVLTLTELQRAGGKRLPAADFLRGFALQAGQSFELPRL
ncbi:MAG: methionyl-tRNA formyltransferase [Polaromonas sp.]|uniref:methionyl-tRNA formyltransferase n=1 Tax=Polaromonas sp. TaxID=1869339 RepID=UPI002730EA71|nr:methionyl-tRNA formyltransferase [Polaromonas sp.]MDP2256470.1 methionyl-tRNA formyltransferase [Polaromonas sp.]